MRRIISIALTALTLCSCIFEDMSDCPNYVEDVGDPIDVEFCVGTADTTQTRSSVGVSENAVKNLTICIYHDGKLVTNQTFESPSTFSVSLVRGYRYNMYAVANYGKNPNLQTEEEMLGFKFVTGDITKISSGFPMSWELTGYLAGKDSDKVTVSLERLVSKINLSIDRSELEEFTVNSVKLCQGARMVYPFKDESKAEEAGDVGDGDHASSADLTAINSGKSICFYALENCQGVLLPNNRSADSKIPSEIPSGADLCTYLEMSASYSGEYQGVSVSSDNVKYRFYIGNDNCSDFNVRRNSEVNINLTVTKDRIFDESWKVSYGEDLPNISYGLAVSQSSVSLNVGGSATLSATYYKNADGTRVSSTDVSSYAAWTSSNTSVATVSNGKITAVAAGTATITATYNGYKATASVTVKDVLGYGLVLSKSTLSVEAGSTAALEVYYVKYTNGAETSRTNVTSSATWKSSQTSVLTVSGGTVTGVSAGQAVVTASYSNFNQSCTVTVTKKPVQYTYALEVSPSSASVYVGGTAKVTATYVTYADGVKSSTKDVTSSASWTSSDADVATVSAGTITGIANGGATITAAYNGYSGNVSVNVANNVTYDLILSPASVSVVSGKTNKLTAVLRTFTNGQQTNGSEISSKCTWTCDNTSVATVNEIGLVTGVSPGSAVVTCKYENYTVKGNVTVTSATTYTLELSPSPLVLSKGQTATLTAKYSTYKDGVFQYSQNVASSATWSSASTSIAGVSQGHVSGVGAGSTVISAKYNGITATVSVTVKGQATLTLGWSSQSMEKGQVLSNAAIYNPNDGTSAQVVTSAATWKTSNAAVATVASGQITAQGSGSATITATYNGLSASCVVTVSGGTPTPVNAYVASMSVTSDWVSGNEYKLTLSLTMSDGTKLENVPYTWSVVYAQSPDISVSTSGDGPLFYIGGGTTYTMAVTLTTTGSYKDSSGNSRKFTTSTSFSHNTSWTP